MREIGMSFVNVLTYAYNTNIHPSHNCTAFDMELERAPHDLKIDKDREGYRQVAWNYNEEWELRMEGSI